MARTRHIWRHALWTCLFALFTPSKCGQYAAFITDLGTQLIVLNSEGNFTYSPCNSGSTPAWPTKSPLLLPVSVEPKSGSNIAAVGFIEDDTVYADLFYQNTGLNIEHERFKCNADDGTYTLMGRDSPDGELADDPEMPDISLFTGLATVRLVLLAGTRLFFHDTNATLHQIEYGPDNTWSYIGMVNPDGHLQGPAVGAAVINAARSDKNIEIASTFSGTPWTVAQVVFSQLEGWPSQVANLALAIDQDASKFIYYIGSDKYLYNLSSVADTNLGAWSINPSMDTQYWPLADDEAADFAVASNPANYDLRIYYMSGGCMKEVSRTGMDTWAEAKALPTTITNTQTPSASAAAASATTGTNSSKGTSAASSSSSPGKLSSAAQVGVGIGAGLAGLLIAGGAIVFLLRRRAQKNQQTSQDEATLAPQRDGKIQNYGTSAGASRSSSSSAFDQYAHAKGSKHDAPLPPLPDKMEQDEPRAVTSSGGASVVYVPAYELPTSPGAPKYEMPGTPTASARNASRGQQAPEMMPKNLRISKAGQVSGAVSPPGTLSPTMSELDGGTMASFNNITVSSQPHPMVRQPSQDTWASQDQTSAPLHYGSAS
ncbi:hypothetical protein M406DRAFT_69102 [Cryphonectria parasitica EP155]|uniref:Uncharacterized protein n=1 Tax=Cryphonectria parasitica (strain ATCC 38755 / EP155) TaxID=660469 RepID=A0A9P5CR59_CRYP1|nr:uncharacterized protein M406DRAFT_69102 [Cryphonectria parasitica EP155]KAF3766926.1 hypothetical protein M406DRAFT_69102 [Cryphonectria parasitica EP155]